MTHSQESDIPQTEAQHDVDDALKSTASTEAHQPTAAPEERTDVQAETQKPRPVPSPASMRPGPTASPASIAKPAAEAHAAQQTPLTPAVPTHRTDLEEARQFADVAEDGHVVLIDGSDRVPVGQVPDVPKDEALAYFVRKYDDAMSQVLLLEQRLATETSTADLRKTLTQLQTTTDERHMVGDMVALRKRIASLETTLEVRRTVEKEAHQKAVDEQRTARKAIVDEAVTISEQDPQRTQWKDSSRRMTELFEQWKTAQKQGPRLPKPEEDELWKRFRAARSTFDKHRRAFFSQLDQTNAEAKKVKERLIARAEELSSSTDWSTTAMKYRDLMSEWKAAPRASRREDDALWTRFRAAQDVFFNARKATNDEIDREFEENLKVKEAILDEGNKLLPFKNVDRARAAINELRGRWDDAGKVPRKDIGRMESGFRRLEEALSQAEQEHWRRTNPETKARTNSALTQLEDAIAGLEQDLAKAQERNDQKSIKKAQEALDARKLWLQTLQASAGTD
ncbi:MAG: DUF349 domain-containing protein [Micrococcaceae bacterium]